MIMSAAVSIVIFVVVMVGLVAGLTQEDMGSPVEVLSSGDGGVFGVLRPALADACLNRQALLWDFAELVTRTVVIGGPGLRWADVVADLVRTRVSESAEGFPGASLVVTPVRTSCIGNDTVSIEMEIQWCLAAEPLATHSPSSATVLTALGQAETLSVSRSGWVFIDDAGDFESKATCRDFLKTLWPTGAGVGVTLCSPPDGVAMTNETADGRALWPRGVSYPVCGLFPTAEPPEWGVPADLASVPASVLVPAEGFSADSGRKGFVTSFWGNTSGAMDQGIIVGIPLFRYPPGTVDLSVAARLCSIVSGCTAAGTDTGGVGTVGLQTSEWLDPSDAWAWDVATGMPTSGTTLSQFPGGVDVMGFDVRPGTLNPASVVTVCTAAWTLPTPPCLGVEATTDDGVVNASTTTTCVDGVGDAGLLNFASESGVEPTRDCMCRSEWDDAASIGVSWTSGCDRCDAPWVVESPDGPYPGGAPRCVPNPDPYPCGVFGTPMGISPSTGEVLCACAGVYTISSVTGKCVCAPGVCGSSLSGTCSTNTSDAAPGCACREGYSPADPSDPSSPCTECFAGWAMLKASAHAAGAVGGSINGTAWPLGTCAPAAAVCPGPNLVLSTTQIDGVCTYSSSRCFTPGGVSETGLPCMDASHVCGVGVTDAAATVAAGECVCSADGGWFGVDDCRSCPGGQVLVSTGAMNGTVTGICGVSPPGCVNPASSVGLTGCSCYDGVDGACSGCVHGFELTPAGTCVYVPEMDVAISTDVCGDAGSVSSLDVTRPSGVDWECVCTTGAAQDRFGGVWSSCDAACAPGYIRDPAGPACLPCRRDCVCAAVPGDAAREVCTECSASLNRVEDPLPVVSIGGDQLTVQCGDCLPGYVSDPADGANGECHPCPGASKTSSGGADNCVCAWPPHWVPGPGWALSPEDGSCTRCSSGHAGPSCAACSPACPVGTLCTYDTGTGDVVCGCAASYRQPPSPGSSSGCGECLPGFATRDTDPLAGVCEPCTVDCGETSGRGFCDAPPDVCVCNTGYESPGSACSACLAGWVPNSSGGCTQCVSTCPSISGGAATACTAPGVCDCSIVNRVHSGSDPEGLRSCGACVRGVRGDDCDVVCPARCSGHGDCGVDGCECDAGYTGPTCSTCDSGRTKDPDTGVCVPCPVSCAYGAPCTFFSGLGMAGCDCSYVRRSSIVLGGFVLCTSTCAPPWYGEDCECYAGRGCPHPTTGEFPSPTATASPGTSPSASPVSTPVPVIGGAVVVGCPILCGDMGVCVLTPGTTSQWSCVCKPGSAHASDNATSPCLRCDTPLRESPVRCVPCNPPCEEPTVCNEDGLCRVSGAFLMPPDDVSWTSLDTSAFSLSPGDLAVWTNLGTYISVALSMFWYPFGALMGFCVAAFVMSLLYLDYTSVFCLCRRNTKKERKRSKKHKKNHRRDRG